MAAAKKQRVSERIESSEDKVKGNALYFLQGREMRLEFLDIPSLIASLDGIPDEEKLAHFMSLAKSLKTPRLKIVTVGEDGVKKVHRDVPLKGENGVYDLQVPDIFPRDGADKYEVCGTVHIKQSFTKDRHDTWEVMREEKALAKNQARQSEIRREVRSKIPSNEEIHSIRQQLPELRNTLKTLSKRQAEAFLDMDVTPEQLEQIAVRIKLTTTRIKDLETQLTTWENSNDPFAQALEASPLNKELQDLSDETNLAFLEFIHKISVEDGLTDESFDDWKARANADDYANAIELVSEGNAFWTNPYGKVATPLSQEQERKRELAKLLN